jgi:hypothetical protein
VHARTCSRRLALTGVARSTTCLVISCTDSVVVLPHNHWLWNIHLFFWWRVPASPEYEDLYARQLKKQHKLATLEGKKDEMERVARSKVGLWSEYGLAAVRDKFWYMVNEGTGFAKRSTWWDAFFLVLSGRGDEGIAGFLMRLLMNFVFNFTIGMFGAISISLLPTHSLHVLPRALVLFLYAGV